MVRHSSPRVNRRRQGKPLDLRPTRKIDPPSLLSSSYGPTQDVTEPNSHHVRAAVAPTPAAAECTAADPLANPVARAAEYDNYHDDAQLSETLHEQNHPSDATARAELLTLERRQRHADRAERREHSRPLFRGFTRWRLSFHSRTAAVGSNVARVRPQRRHHQRDVRGTAPGGGVRTIFNRSPQQLFSATDEHRHRGGAVATFHHLATRAMRIANAFSISLFLLAIPLAWQRLWHISRVTWHGLGLSPVVTSALGLVWLALVIAVIREVHRQVRGVAGSPTLSSISALAALLISLASFFVSSAGAAAPLSPRSYIVQPGDSLWGIAQKTLGDAEKWPEIAAWNRASLPDPRLLHPGTSLHIFDQGLVPHSETRIPTAAGSMKRAPTAPPHAMSAPQWLGIGLVPLALAAKRRRDEILQGRHTDDDVDETILLLRHRDATLLKKIRGLLPPEPCGRISIPHDVATSSHQQVDAEPVVIVPIAQRVGHTLLAFARPGSSLPLPVTALNIVANYAVAGDPDRRCHVAKSSEELVRALALRQSLEDVVVYGGPASDLEEQFAARCVTLSTGSTASDLVDEQGEGPWRFLPAIEVAPARSRETWAPSMRNFSSPVRVELLRAEPQILGLVHEFPASLRRRCVEMSAYLALHAHEAITGDRLRARVLTDSSFDATQRTLANTASAIRSSCGSTERGPRLRPVSAQGLYRLHDVGCDLTDFESLVVGVRDRGESPRDLIVALRLVHGEPLAAVLKGFDWFLAEGHLARLQRLGEWAALTLAEHATASGEWDVAFWAIEKGRLLDPYNDTLTAALHRIPRLRELGGNRSSGSQDQTIGSGGTVTMRGALSSFTN